MKITKIQCDALAIPYKVPYQISPGTIRAARRVLVHIETDEGITGKMDWRK